MPNPIADPFVEVPDSDARSSFVRIDATASGIATVSLERSGRKNAFNAEVIGALHQAFETLAGADGVRVVFVTGSEGVFSAGADLDWMRDAADFSEADNRDDAMRMAAMLKELHDLPMLTVALVEGPAFGGGAGLAAACDMAVATRTARFAFSEVRLGLVAATISPYVVAAIGPRRARGLFATGAPFDAEEAVRIGLVDRLVDGPLGLLEAREAIAREAVLAAPEAVRRSKRLVEHVAGRAIDHGLMEHTAHEIARVRVGPEGQEGVRAFLDRRRPAWLADDGADL
ncbi:MAG: enoyl-CoA hydratase/isomerase family protein [Caulobacteraceae bacterium]|nr:enoyl-CoA hydratase/isomerase family protein [Caulobacteraceae bacterium]